MELILVLIICRYYFNKLEIVICHKKKKSMHGAFLFFELRGIPLEYLSSNHKRKKIKSNDKHAKFKNYVLISMFK